ncbi:SRPBCC family protein [Limimaricola pyoseonensis]|uniref:Polyketide cyclase / dehydrase and lipid transport n=1 Tax=Limimaricola pyoseonensis TaxID=521013 RepID=A0A1G7I5M4_9RHOB|nr:SRPBCC family protein [Limimaricola pyoseonensis]SDF07659.1 Polyketide cyclase / dehydrase and lipid transport [Limimaricola pyoseonensis]
MELTTRQPVAAPRDFVFAQASDFDAFERLALRRGIAVDTRGAGTARGWGAEVPIMGRTRRIEADLQRYDAPEGYEVLGRVSGVEVLVRVEVSAAAEGAALGLSVRLGAQGMTGKMALQPLALMRGSLESRMAAKLEGYAREIEARWARSRATA